MQGSTLAGAEVLADVAGSLERTTGPIAERMLAALEASQSAGGDCRGQQSAALLVVRAPGAVLPRRTAAGIRSMQGGTAAMTGTWICAWTITSGRWLNRGGCGNFGKPVGHRETMTMLRGSSLDRFGSIASTVCALHCALSPLVFGLLPLLGGSGLNERWLEPAFVSLSFGFAAMAVKRGYALHGRRVIVVLFALGFAAIAAGRWIVGDTVPWLESGLVVVGSLTIVLAHRRNHSACVTCLVCNSMDTPECD